jgi:predicted GNAT family acetyltransferase
MPENPVIDNVQAHRFEMHAGGRTAFLVYGQSHGSLRLIHTEVPPELRGAGIGSQLVAGVLDTARTRGLIVIPQCPFVIQYLKRHPEYAGIVAPESLAKLADE